MNTFIKIQERLSSLDYTCIHKTSKGIEIRDNRAINNFKEYYIEIRDYCNVFYSEIPGLDESQINSIYKKLKELVITYNKAFELNKKYTPLNLGIGAISNNPQIVPNFKILPFISDLMQIFHIPNIDLWYIEQYKHKLINDAKILDSFYSNYLFNSNKLFQIINKIKPFIRTDQTQSSLKGFKSGLNSTQIEKLYNQSKDAYIDTSFENFTALLTNKKCTPVIWKFYRGLNPNKRALRAFINVVFDKPGQPTTIGKQYFTDKDGKELKLTKVETNDLNYQAYIDEFKKML